MSRSGEFVVGAGDLHRLHGSGAEKIAAGIETVKIRTVMTCHAEHGVCQKCYGFDSGHRPSG